MVLLVIGALGPANWTPRTALGWQIDHFQRRPAHRPPDPQGFQPQHRAGAIASCDDLSRIAAAGANLSLMIIGIGGVLGLLIGGANGYIQRGWLRHCQPTPFLL
jgi:hypothetical protein